MTNPSPAAATLPLDDLPAVPGYGVFGELARGGMGAVLRAEDTRLGRELAVKVLLEKCQDDPDLVARFVAEAKLQGRLQHPGIVPVHELGEYAPGRPFFSMTLIGGQTLATLLAARPTPQADLPRFVQLFEQVCQAVAYAHAQGVLHRDLKPANIMVGAFGEVQVMDWGLAKRLATPEDPTSRRLCGSGEPGGTVDFVPRAGDTPGTNAGAVLGTPAFMAPEQARGDHHGLDARTDVFALGAILCETLTGKPPYPGPTAIDMLAQAQAGDLDDACARLDRCGADADLVALAEVCLAAEPADRPADAGAVAQAVAAHREAVAERLTSARVAQAAAEARAAAEAKTRAAVQARLAAERQRRRLLADLAAVLLLGLTVAGLLGWLADAQRRKAEAAEEKAYQAYEQLTSKESLAFLREAAEEKTYQAYEQLTSKESLAFLRTEDQRLTVDQRAFLEQATAFFREVTAKAEADEKGRARAAGAYFRLGYLLQDLGQVKEPELANRAAVEGYAGLARDFPAAPDYRNALAASYHSLGILMAGLGQMLEANRAYRRALELQEALVHAFPAVPAYRHGLAKSHTNLGILLANAGMPEAAEAEYRAALALQEGLARDFPAVPHYRVELAGNNNSLGLLLAGMGRWGEAEAAYRQALALREELARDFPAVPHYRLELAGSYVNFGNLVRDQGQPAEGLPWYAKAVPLLKNLLRRDPRDAPGRLFLRNAHSGQAQGLASLGCFPEPKTAWELALKYNDLSQDTPGFQRSHGIAAVAAGWAQDHAWPLLWGWPRP